MSKKKTETGTRVQRNRKVVEVKGVHYGTERLVDCMKAVIQMHMDRNMAVTGGEYEQ